MSAKVSEQDISQSVLNFVTDGTYPVSEQIVASDFPSSFLAKELELISKAKEQVEVSSVSNAELRLSSSSDGSITK